MLKLATKFAPDPCSFEMAHSAGFRHAELFLSGPILVDWQTICRHARKYPNSYALHFPNQLDLPPEALDAIVALYRNLGCGSLIVHQPMLDKYREALLRLEPELQFAVENHRLTKDGFSRWAEENPGLALDVEHLWKFTCADGPLEDLLEQLASFLNRFGHKLRHVHMPGYWPGFKEHRPMYCARDLVFPVLSLLAESEFKGLVVSEVDMQFQNPMELQMDVLLFKAWREEWDQELQRDQATKTD